MIWGAFLTGAISFPKGSSSPGTLTASFGAVEGTGRSFWIDQAVITHLRDGKVIEAWEIADFAALRAQVAEG